MDKKYKKKHYYKEDPINLIYDLFRSKKVSFMIQMQNYETVQIGKLALFDFLVAVRANEPEKLDQYLLSVKKRLRQEGGEREQV